MLKIKADGHLVCLRGLKRCADFLQSQLFRVYILNALFALKVEQLLRLWIAVIKSCVIHVRAPFGLNLEVPCANV
jgi:hypothetical protein